MKLFPRSRDDQNDTIYTVFGLPEQEAEQQESTQIPWHCGWCQPYVNGATTGICASCEEKYFPRKKGHNA